MNFRRLTHSKLILRLPIAILLMISLMPASTSTVAQAVEVIVEDPQLNPAYTTCPQSYWYALDNNRGHATYLTLNTNNPQHSTNSGEWHPVIPQAGYYRVEAYIAGHAPIVWCTGPGRTIDGDTSDAHYSIHHVYGVTERPISQHPLSNQWVDLGEYYFNAGTSGYVSLRDLNGETEYSTTVSFSAMRFTYTRATRPQVYLPWINHFEPAGPPPPDVGIIQAQGFDACYLPSISAMQTWWNQSPYDFYAIYLGGIQLPRLCALADATWVSAVHQQGWSFAPTWVGPQAACSGYDHVMSSDPAVSYHEGRREADYASAAANTLGLTNYGWGGTVIYYDMEVFGGASLECRQAAAAFINGWVERLGELGNIAGGYGAHNSYIEDWATLEHTPQYIWAAAWYTDKYDPYATVYSIPWLNGLWINHQRIRQYAWDHSETWGNVQLGIDSDVADGLVAMPPTKPLATPIVNASPSIEDAGWLSETQGWLVSGNHLYWTNDRGQSWSDISPATIQLAYFLPDDQAYALTTPDKDGVSLLRSSDWGKTWEELEFPLPAENWRPRQMHFTSSTNGWIVIQMETSQAFSVAVLMETADSGSTWRTVELPMAGDISFTSPSEAWLVNEAWNVIYHTTDGGTSWQPAQADKYLLPHPALPDGITLSGWQTTDLGWAVTSIGACNGDKFTIGFGCQVNIVLWQTMDGGKNWDAIPLPDSNILGP